MWPRTPSSENCDDNNNNNNNSNNCCTRLLVVFYLILFCTRQISCLIVCPWYLRHARGSCSFFKGILKWLYRLSILMMYCCRTQSLATCTAYHTYLKHTAVSARTSLFFYRGVDVCFSYRVYVCTLLCLFYFYRGIPSTRSIRVYWSLSCDHGLHFFIFFSPSL